MAKTCFFISRIGDPGSPERDFSDKLLKYVVAPVVEKCGYEKPVRADHITQPGVITTQVFTHLWNDDLVIADLTGGNPNVFYELAVRHIRRAPFVHLIQAGAQIPFDIAPNRTIQFDFDVEKAESAKAALERMVRWAPEDDPANVQTPLSAAVDFATAGTNSDPLSGAIAQILSDIQEIKGRVQGASSPTAWGRLDNRPVRNAILERFSTKMRELGVSIRGMSMPVEVSGGITMRFGDRDVEVSIGDAADLVDGILKPVEFLKKIGV